MSQGITSSFANAAEARENILLRHRIEQDVSRLLDPKVFVTDVDVAKEKSLANFRIEVRASYLLRLASDPHGRFIPLQISQHFPSEDMLKDRSDIDLTKHMSEVIARLIVEDVPSRLNDLLWAGNR